MTRVITQNQGINRYLHTAVLMYYIILYTSNLIGLYCNYMILKDSKNPFLIPSPLKPALTSSLLRFSQTLLTTASLHPLSTLNTQVLQTILNPPFPLHIIL